MSDNLIKCTHSDCNLEATHDSPSDLCQKHWFEWFNEDTPEEDWLDPADLGVE